MEINEYFELLDLSESLSFTQNEANCRLAILSDCSTQQLKQILKAVFFQKGVAAEILETGYDSFAGEILNSNSDLYKFNPTEVLMLFAPQKYREVFLEASVEQKERLSSETANLIEKYCRVLSDRGIQAIVNTFPLPVERQFGNYSLRTKQSLYSSVWDLNQRLVDIAQKLKNVSLLDCMYLANKFGTQRFLDEKLWVMAKSFCSNAYLPALAKEIVAISHVTKGFATKCVVVDLDNTLWGGIIADDGVEGLELGRTGAGESHLALQRYLLSLKQRGYFLAACSKNDLSNAELPFLKHPEMILKKEDFSVFVANWEPKSENIQKIAKELNIGTSSLIFLDDSPFERDEVKKRLPDVLVPELPEDPAEFVATLENLHLFETLSLSKEDLLRAQAPTQEVFKELEKKFESFEEYLKSLEMKMEVRPFSRVDLPRIAQLIQRSNQFNVRTQRFTESQCEKFIEDKEFLTLSFSLKDRLTDYGLIGLAICKWENKVLRIEELLMSCRVLKRGVEEFILSHLVERALSKPCQKIVLNFIKTEKNQLALDYVQRSGFKLSEKGEFELDLYSFNTYQHAFREVLVR